MALCRFTKPLAIKGGAPLLYTVCDGKSDETILICRITAFQLSRLQSRKILGGIFLQSIG